MEAIVLENAKVLVPNKEHKNFTETSEVIPQGTTLIGEFKSIKGLRRGEPFSYRVFITQNGQIIYSNKVKEMKATEVTLGADATVTPTTVDLIPAETFKKERLIVASAGAAGAFWYARRKGHATSKALVFAAVGAAAGYAAVWAFDKSKAAVITPSK